MQEPAADQQSVDLAGEYIVAAQRDVVGAFSIARDGLRAVESLRSFISEKAAIEQIHASALKRLIASHTFPDTARAPGTTVTTMLEALHAETDSSARAYSASSARLQNGFVAALSNLHDTASKRVDALWSQYSRAHAAVHDPAAATSLAALSAREKRVAAAMRTAQEMRHEHATAAVRAGLARTVRAAARTSAQAGHITPADAEEMARAARLLTHSPQALAELEARAAAATRKALRADTAYMEAVFRAQTAHAALESTTYNMLSSLRESEIDRLATLARIGRLFAQHCAGVAVQLNAAWSSAAVPAAAADPAADVLALARRLTPRKASALPPAPQYTVPDCHPAILYAPTPAPTSAAASAAALGSAPVSSVSSVSSVSPVSPAAPNAPASAPATGAAVVAPDAAAATGTAAFSASQELSDLETSDGPDANAPTRKPTLSVTAATGTAAAPARAPGRAGPSISASAGADAGAAAGDNSASSSAGDFADAALTKATAVFSSFSSFFSGALPAPAPAAAARAQKQAGPPPLLSLASDPPASAFRRSPAVSSVLDGTGGGDTTAPSPAAVSAAAAATALALDTRAALLSGCATGGLPSIGLASVSRASVEAQVRDTERVLVDKVEAAAAAAAGAADAGANDDDDDSKTFFGLSSSSFEGGLSLLSSAAAGAVTAVTAASAAASAAVSEVQRQIVAELAANSDADAAGASGAASAGGPIYHSRMGSTGGGAAAEGASARADAADAAAAADDAAPKPGRANPVLVRAAAARLHELVALNVGVSSSSSSPSSSAMAGGAAGDGAPPAWRLQPPRIGTDTLELCGALCATEAGRQAFASVLNGLRNSRVTRVSAPAYRNLCALASLCLDLCLEDVQATASVAAAAGGTTGASLPDVRPAQLVLMLAHTIHCAIPAADDGGECELDSGTAEGAGAAWCGDASGESLLRDGLTWGTFDTRTPAPPGTAATAAENGSDGRRKVFLIEGLKDHSVWQNERFWKACLIENVNDAAAQAAATDDADGGETPGRAAATRTECAFAALSSLMAAMLACGVSAGAVRKFAAKWAAAYRLAPEQTEMLWTVPGL